MNGRVILSVVEAAARKAAEAMLSMITGCFFLDCA
jgi:hypothetical protein